MCNTQYLQQHMMSHHILCIFLKQWSIIAAIAWSQCHQPRGYLLIVTIATAYISSYRAERICNAVR